MQSRLMGRERRKERASCKGGQNDDDEKVVTDGPYLATHRDQFVNYWSNWEKTEQK